MTKTQSVEPNIADLANGWLKSYKLDYKLEQESLNTEIDQALNDYYSKNGGVGGNRPDAKLLLQDKNLVNYPILIEYKGYKDKLVKLDSEGKVANKTAKNQPDFKNINSYAVNGAVHYANALLHYTSYTDIIAIGMTGFKDDSGNLEYEIGVYYVSKSNFGIGQKVDDYTDFSFLKKTNFDKFIDKVKKLKLTQDEIERLKEQREQEINTSLVKLNNDIYQNEKGLSERDRVYLVAASIIATLGVPGKVAALEKQELKSSTEEENRDGDIILRKIKAFLNEKNLPQEKRELIVRTLQNTLTTDNINKVENGESQLKRVFTKIVDDLGTDAEIEKYNTIKKLLETLSKALEWAPVENAFSDKKCLKLALQNCGTDIDEDIEISLRIPKNSLLPINEFPKFNNDEMGYLLNDCNMSELFGICSTSTYSDYDSSIVTSRRFSPRVSTPSIFPGYTSDYSDDFESELSDVFCYSCFDEGEEYIVKLKFDYIKHNTTIAFPSIIFINESFKSIPYTITSKNSPEIVSGKIKITDDTWI